MKLLLTLLLSLSVNSFAHDGGHGPKVKDAPKQGGIVAPVVLSKDAGLGSKAEMKHKAEIVRSQDGVVRVYFYDKAMTPLKTGTLSPKAEAVLISGKKGKLTEQKFELTWKEDHFEGKSPKPSRKPYNIEVKVTEAGAEFLVAFANLD